MSRSLSHSLFRFKQFCASYWLWGLLSLLPLLWIFQALSSTTPRIFHILVHPSGEWAVRLLILTMMITPMTMLLKGWAVPRWLRKHRRTFGVAAFGYMALHLGCYLIDTAGFSALLADLSKIWIAAGWLAFLIFVPMAITSTNWLQRNLGRSWKPLQRSTYVAAALVLLHWAALKDWKEPQEAVMWFAPLLALEAYRLWYWYLRPRPTRLT